MVGKVARYWLGMLLGRWLGKRLGKWLGRWLGYGTKTILCAQTAWLGEVVVEVEEWRWTAFVKTTTSGRNSISRVRAVSLPGKADKIYISYKG